MPYARNDPRRRALCHDRLPKIDLELWHAGVRVADGLDNSGITDGWSRHSLRKVAYGYRRWLGFLDWIGELDPSEHPADRITPRRVAAYFRLMMELDNSPFSIVARFSELCTALRVIAPERDLRWLRAPGGRSIRSRLRMVRKPRPIYDCRVLFAWGLRLMAEAVELMDRHQRCLQMRDGLLIATLAGRAMRVRSVHSIRMGDQLVCQDGRWRIVFGPEDMKTKRDLDYELPDEMIPHLERYLAVERHELLAGRQHDGLWVGLHGSRLSYGSIGQAIRKRSALEFGHGFGLHVFRYALGSTAPAVNPAEPGLGPAVLGISARVFQESYNRAGVAHAAQRFHAQLRADRARTEPLARRAFPPVAVSRRRGG